MTPNGSNKNFASRYLLSHLSTHRYLWKWKPLVWGFRELGSKHSPSPEQKTVKRNKVNNNANKILWNFIIFFIIRRAYETEKSRPNLIWPHLHAPWNHVNALNLFHVNVSYMGEFLFRLKQLKRTSSDITPFACKRNVCWFCANRRRK